LKIKWNLSFREHTWTLGKTTEKQSNRI
jgi:hypothetical protein